MESNNLPAKSNENPLLKVHKQIAITNKLLDYSVEQKINSFCIKQKEFTLKLISRWYSLQDYHFGYDYGIMLKWELISLNQNIRWTEKLYFSIPHNELTKLNFKDLSSRINFDWNFDIIEKYKTHWDWSELSSNDAISWTTYLIDKYRHFLVNKLTYNKEVLKSVNNMLRYKDDINFKYLSRNTKINWSIEIIELFKDKWDWEELSSNINLPWSEQLIDKYIDNWIWASTDYDNSPIGLSINSGLPLNFDFVKKYQENWYWPFLSINTSLQLSPELIDYFKDRIYWYDFDNEYWRTIEDQNEYSVLPAYGLSSNSTKSWSVEIIDLFQEYLDWKELSRNESICWDIDLLTKYKKKWNWEALSYNKALPWTIDLIGKYKSKWYWRGLSSNTALPWSLNLIQEYEERWDWELLSSNTALPWSVDLIDRYIDKWKWNDTDTYLYHSLSSNPGLPWSYSFIERYKHKWQFNEVYYYTKPAKAGLIKELIAEKDINAFLDKFSMIERIIDIDELYLDQNQEVWKLFESHFNTKCMQTLLDQIKIIKQKEYGGSWISVAF